MEEGVRDAIEMVIVENREVNSTTILLSLQSVACPNADLIPVRNKLDDHRGWQLEQRFHARKPEATILHDLR